MADDDKNKPAPPAPAPPGTPGDVKRTPIKHPQIIAMEKKLSELEDKTDTLSKAVDGVNEFLEGLNLGGRTPVPITKKDDPTPAPAKGGFLADVEKEIFG